MKIQDYAEVVVNNDLHILQVDEHIFQLSL
jgi:hypothetical protein